MLHATAAAEAEDFRALGLRQSIAIIPNGIELPAFPKSEIDNPQSEIGNRQSAIGTQNMERRLYVTPNSDPCLLPPHRILPSCSSLAADRW